MPKDPFTIPRIPLKRALKLADQIEGDFAQFAEFMTVAGSIRRGRPQIKDIEFVVLPKDVPEFVEFARCLGFFGDARILRTTFEGVQIELFLAHKPEEIGGLVFYATGDKVFNIAMRSIAKNRLGLKLDQYGFWDPATKEIVFQSPREEDFFDFLKVRYHAPDERNFKERGKKGAR